MFEEIRQAFESLLNGEVPASERRGMLADMRDSLVRAKLAVEDLRTGVAATRQRLATEQQELATTMRRKTLAEGIGDKETVDVASRFAAHQEERVVVLTKKLEAQELELAFVEREVEEMKVQFKAANAGVGSGLRDGASGTAIPSDRDLGLDDRGAGLAQELGAMDRQRRRETSEADAESRLAELKKRMGL